MNTITFSDGMKINSSGELRSEHLKDGWYVIGEGMIIPCSDEDEAIKTLKEMKND